MADNLSSRGAEARYPNGDPFAELSRIMGRGQPAAPHDDDAGFDLEGELMGGFDDAPGQGHEAPRDHLRSQPEPARFHAAPEPQLADPLDDEFADLFATEFGSGTQGRDNDEAAWAPPAQQSAPRASDVPADAMLAEVDLDFGEADFNDETPALEPEDAVPAQDTREIRYAAPYVAPADWAEAPRAEATRRSIEDELSAMLEADDAGGGAHDPAPYMPLRPAHPAPADYEPAAYARYEDDARYEEDAGAAGPAADDAQVWHGAGEQADAADAPLYDEPAPVYDEPAYDDEPVYEEPPHQEPAPLAQPDPFAVLASLAPAAPVLSAGRFARHAAPVEIAPAGDDFATVPVAEASVPMQDELDLPDLPPHVDEPAVAADPFEAELDFGDFSLDAGTQAAPAAPAAIPLAPADYVDDGRHYAEASAYDGYAPATADDAFYAEYAADQAGYESEVPAEPQAVAAQPEPARRSKGLLAAAVVAGVAVIGGIGAFALSFGGPGADPAPTLVRAGDEPLKVKPENPGGTAVPNQESQAYQRVTGGAAAEAPQQDRLLTTAEEPVSLSARNEPVNDLPGNGLPGVDDEIEELDAAPAPKSEERVEATAETDGIGAEKDLLAVQPRRVRTMVVRPDGTLVPREEAAPVVVAAAPESALPPVLSPEVNAGSGSAQAISGQGAEAVRGVAAPASGLPAPRTVETVRITPDNTAPGATPQAAPQPAPRAAQPAAEPAPRPAVPERQPEPRAEAPRQTQVAQAPAPARAQPAAPAPAAAGEWSMQIASQPTAEGAQSTYQDLARRYGSVIGGRGVNIVRADIPGKGTYYRVRIPSSTRNEAVSLCERYKAAGGSCFVSK